MRFLIVEVDGQRQLARRQTADSRQQLIARDDRVPTVEQIHGGVIRTLESNEEPVIGKQRYVRQGSS